MEVSGMTATTLDPGLEWDLDPIRIELTLDELMNELEPAWDSWRLEEAQA
jgi:hypothetical protein